MSDNTNTQSQSSNKQDMQEQLIAEIKQLRDDLLQIAGSFKTRAKDNLDTSNHQASIKQEELKKSFLALVNNYKSYSVDQLKSLKESLEGQLESLRGYTTKIVEDDELKLVNSLEATLTNVSDITGSQLKNLQSLVGQVGEISEKSKERSVQIVKERNSAVQEELTQELALNRDQLSSKVIELQDNFRDEMNQKIEKVFMGVTMTKEGINGIIRDTLSRLEENLNRLNQGIDENFTKEVGEAQDLIHTYEGKLLEAIEQTQENYNSQMEAVLEKHSKKTEQSLQKVTTELNEFSQQILSQIKGLNKEQEELFQNATQQLENQIAKSKADVIESHGTLKDELEKLLKANKESIDETLSNLRENNAQKVETLQKQVKEKMDSAQQELGNAVGNVKRDVDNNAASLSNKVKQATKKAEENVEKYS